MSALIEFAKSISSPLQLGGLFAVILFAIFKLVIQQGGLRKVTSEHSAMIIRMIIDKLFWLAMVALVLGFAAAVLPRLQPSPNDPISHPAAAAEPPGNKQVIELKRKVVELRGDFEALDTNPQTSNEVIATGVMLANMLEGASDATLDAKRTIIKYEYAGWAYLIAGRATQDPDRRAVLVKKAARMLETALDKMKDVEVQYRAGKPEAAALYEFLVGDSADFSRTRWLLATSYAIQARQFRNRDPADAVALLKEIDEAFLKRYPPGSEPDLAWVVSAR